MNRVFLQSTVPVDNNTNSLDDEETSNRTSLCFNYRGDLTNLDHLNGEIDSMFLLLSNGRPPLNQIKAIEFIRILNDDATKTLRDLFHKNHSTICLKSFRIVENPSMTILATPHIASIVTNQLSSLIDLDLSKNPSMFSENGLELLLAALFDTESDAQSNCRIQRLNLSCNKIGPSGKSVENITQLLINNSSIKHLILSDNRLGPRHMCPNGGVFNNSTLRRLDLSKNLLRGAGVKIVFHAIDQKRHSQSMLEELDISNNSIGCIGAKSIMLVLGENKNRSLKKLNLSYNNIKKEGWTHLDQTLKFNYTLTDVNLSGNQLCGPGNDIDGIQSIADGLTATDYSNLLRLDLAENMIQDGGAVAIATMICANRTLEILNLSNNAIKNTGMNAILDAIQHHIAMKELLLHGNLIDQDETLVAYICDTNKCTLQVLTYSDNRFNDDQINNVKAAFQFHNNSKTWLGRLLDKIQRRKVRCIRLLSSEVVYGDKELQTIVKEVVTYPVELRTVCFDSENITDLGISYFANHVLCSINEQLRVLHFFSYNLTRLRLDGIHSIAQCISRPTCSLLSLSMLNCNVGPEGATAIANCLETNRSLTLLSLRSNHISDVGAKNILAAILNPPHPTLTMLNLSQNQLTDSAVEGVGRFVRLVDVILDENNISDRGVMDLCKAVMDTTTIKYLNLSHNPQVTLKGIQTLQSFLPNQFVLESELLHS